MRAKGRSPVASCELRPYERSRCVERGVTCDRLHSVMPAHRGNHGRTLEGPAQRGGKAKLKPRPSQGRATGGWERSAATEKIGTGQYDEGGVPTPIHENSVWPVQQPGICRMAHLLRSVLMAGAPH